MRRILVALALVGAFGSRSEAQVLVGVGTTVQWDQDAATLAQSVAFTYDLTIKSALTTAVSRLAGVVCVATLSTTRFACHAPTPTLQPGTYTLTLTAVSADGQERSVASNAVTYTIAGGEGEEEPPPLPDDDPRCIFPTGAAAVSIFPTRYLANGPKSAVSFLLASSAPVVRIEALLLAADAPEGEVVATIDGRALNATGALWFPVPKVSGAYRVQLRAANAIGCSVLVTTPFTVKVP